MCHKITAFMMVAVVVVASQAGEGAGQPQDAVAAALLDRNIHAQAVAALEADPELQRNPFAVLVKFQPEANDEARAAARAAAGADTMRHYAIVPGLELVHTTLAPEAAVAALRAMPGVAYAEPDYVVRTSQDPPRLVPNENDSGHQGHAWFWLQWGFDNYGQTVIGTPGTPGADVNAPEAWWISTGDPDFVIAMLDTGIEWDHQDLAANMWINPGETGGGKETNGIDDDDNGYIDDVRGWDFYSQDNDPMDETWHGTHTAGTVGAVGNNHTGVAGMMWECKLMPLRFLGPNGIGLISDAVLALQYATDKGVKVSNHSWGGRNESSSLYDAIEAAQVMNHIVVAAAGNWGKNIDARNGRSWRLYPASYDLDNIIAVAATDKDDRLPRWSSYGLTSVDLGAPGAWVASTFLTPLRCDQYVWGQDGFYVWWTHLPECRVEPGTGYAWASGTSMATPHVSGVVGLVWAQNPAWTYQRVRTQVISTARPVASLARKTVSGGVVDAAAALGAFVPPQPGITVTPTEGLVTTEAGATDWFTVVLNTEPTAAVRIDVSSSDTSEGTVLPASLTFDTTNWDVPQEVTVTGVDDSEPDGDISYSVITAPAVSDDLEYNGLNADDVSVTNLDDDGVVVECIDPISMPRDTTESVTITGSGFVSGATVTFENGGGPAPTADVTSVSVDGTTIEAMVSVHKKAKLLVWDVRVTNSDGSSGVLVDRFTVTP